MAAGDQGQLDGAAGSDERSGLEAEVARLRRRVAELEAAEARRERAESSPMVSELVDAGELLNVLLENIPDYVYFKDADRRFVLASRSFTELLGRELPEILHHRDEDLFPPEIAADTIADDRGVIEDGVPILNKLEGGRVSEDVERWVSTTKLPWLGQDGTVRGLYGISSEVTEIKKARDDLRESGARLRQILDGLFGYVGLLTVEGVLVESNRAPLEAAGLRAEDVIGQPYWETYWWSYDAALRARLRVLVGRALAGETPRCQERMRIRDGALRDLDLSFRPMRDDEGSVSGVLAFGVDVTERVRAERALRESERHFRELCNTLPHSIWTCDPEGACDFINDRWLSYTGKPLEAHLGAGWLNQIHPDDQAPTLAAWRSSVESGRPFGLECRVRGHDGEFRPFAARAVRICNAEGKTVRWFGSCTDISELKSAQMQLLQAGKLAALGTFGAGIAHELNQPLTVIRLLTERLQISGGVNRVGAEALNGIESQVSRMSRIVNNLLAFSHKSEARRELVGAIEPLEAALELMAAQLRLAGVAIERRYGEDLSAIAVDPVHAQSVFFNLLSNALHALEMLPAGAPRILELSVSERGGRVRYRVRDSGPGVSEKAAKQLFDPFFTTKEVGKGTGLGLSLAYGILKEHGGSIELESPAGQGACFRVELPAASGEARPRPPREPEARATPGKARGRRVLVVDDESAVRGALAGLISEWGYIPIEASCGREALAAVSEVEPEIAFVDLTLPQESGVTICAAIRERSPRVKIVPISGYATPENRSKLAAMGLPMILEKPMEPSALLQVLEELPDQAEPGG